MSKPKGYKVPILIQIGMPSTHWSSRVYLKGYMGRVYIGRSKLMKYV